MNSLDTNQDKRFIILRESEIRKESKIKPRNIIFKLNQVANRKRSLIASFITLLHVSSGSDDERILNEIFCCRLELKGLYLAMDEIKKLVDSVEV